MIRFELTIFGEEDVEWAIRLSLPALPRPGDLVNCFVNGEMTHCVVEAVDFNEEADGQWGIYVSARTIQSINARKRGGSASDEH